MRPPVIFIGYRADLLCQLLQPLGLFVGKNENPRSLRFWGLRRYLFGCHEPWGWITAASTFPPEAKVISLERCNDDVARTYKAMATNQVLPLRSERLVTDPFSVLYDAARFCDLPCDDWQLAEVAENLRA